MTLMAVFQHAPFARAIQTRALTIACCSSASAVAPPSRVLLGMPEQELQQLALQFGQEGYRGKQLHHLLYKSKVKEIPEFSNLPLAFRNELQEAGWSVGRSPVYKEVTAADDGYLFQKISDSWLIYRANSGCFWVKSNYVL